MFNGVLHTGDKELSVARKKDGDKTNKTNEHVVNASFDRQLLN